MKDVGDKYVFLAVFLEFIEFIAPGFFVYFAEEKRDIYPLDADHVLSDDLRLVVHLAFHVDEGLQMIV